MEFRTNPWEKINALRMQYEEETDCNTIKSAFYNLLTQMAFEFEVMQESISNLEQQVQELYNKIKQNHLLNINVIPSFNWASKENKTQKNIFSLINNQTLQYEGLYGEELTEDTQHLLQEKNDLIKDLKEEIFKLEQRLETQSKKSEWKISLKKNERESNDKKVKETIQQIGKQREDNKLICQKIRTLAEKNNEFLKLYEQQLLQYEKGKSTKKIKKVYQVKKNKESLIQELEERQIEREAKKIKEKLKSLQGVGMIESFEQY